MSSIILTSFMKVYKFYDEVTIFKMTRKSRIFYSEAFASADGKIVGPKIFTLSESRQYKR